MHNPTQLEALFFAALEQGSAAERTAYLNAACGANAEIRREVERLLRFHAQLGDFLAKPVTAHLPTALADFDATRRATPPFDTPGATETTGLDQVLGLLAPARTAGSLGRLADYDVLELVGRGGFGIVFRAFDESLEREVAIKVLVPNLAQAHEARTGFLREARAAAKVRHEHLVHVYAVDDQPLPHLVMEYVPGDTLQARIARLGPLETAEVVRIGRQIAEGLAAAHEKGVIHRDVKPANILLESSSPPRVKLTDFGLARAANEAQVAGGSALAGTPMYMAPEQVRGDAIDQRSDLFSLGSVLYAMCTGIPPFRAETTLGVLQRVTSETPRAIRELNPAIPPWLCELISKLHAKAPAERIATAREVSALLAAGADAKVEPRSEPATPARATHAAPAIRRRLATWVAAAALVLGTLSLTEIAGITGFRGVVIRLLWPDGTLVVEVDDPGIQLKLDDSELHISGAGFREIRLKPGQYTLEANRNGQAIRRELITITQGGRRVLRISQEPSAPRWSAEELSAWEQSVAAMPAAEQWAAVELRLRQLNPGLQDLVPLIAQGAVAELKIASGDVVDLSPLRALPKLRKLECASMKKKGTLADLQSLRGLSLTHLDIYNNPVSDLTPLAGMPLVYLHCPLTNVFDLTPLRGMPLRQLYCAYTPVSDLSPLRGLSLTTATFEGSQVADLSPLAGMPLESLSIGKHVTDLRPLAGMPLKELTCAFASQLVDISPLAGLPLQSINLGGTSVADLQPVADLPLLNLNIPKTNVTDLTPLRDMTTLKRISLGDLARLADLSPLYALGVEDLNFSFFRADRDASKLRPLSSVKTMNGQPALDFWNAVDHTP